MLIALGLIYYNEKEAWQWHAQYFKLLSPAVASQLQDVYARCCVVLKKRQSNL